MVNYTPPSNTNILFSFSSGGYSKPAFDDIPLNYHLRPSYTSTSTLQASIDIMQLHQDSTYTYLKECPTVIVGYTNNGVQTLQLPCIYGGIRDLGSFINSQPNSIDLAAEILVLYNYLDLTTYFKFSDRSSLNLALFTRPTLREEKDLSSWFRYNKRDTKDLGGYVRFMRGSEVEVDLNAYLLEAIQPVDLKALVDVIELRNIQANISGIWWKGQTDVEANFYRFYYRQDKDIFSTIHGWDITDLHAQITSFQFSDLLTTLNAGFFAIHKNLNALVGCVSPVTLQAYIHSYDTLNLSAYTSVGYQPNDLQSTIIAIKPFDLPTFITAMKGIKTPFNLPAHISGFFIKNLLCYINTIESVDLQVYIDAIGKYLDLTAKINPRTINIKRILYVPLFEHKDLRAVINYNCLKSNHSDLAVNMYVIRNKDLRAYIIGWFSGTADNLKDLKAYINCSDYTTQGYINISGSAHFEHYSLHGVYGGKLEGYKTFDTYTVIGGKAINNLSAYIEGILTSYDLPVEIHAKPLANFSTVPHWINPKTHEVVLNIERFEERWVRFVELMFFSNGESDYHYFYVSGEDKIYKIDRNRTWQIRVIGYSKLENNIYDRVKINKKFIFNLNNYTSVDEAIRDLIDRVSLYRHKDLSAYIYAYDLEYTSLEAVINIKQLYSWTANLKSTIKGWVSDSNTLDISIFPTP